MHIKPFKQGNDSVAEQIESSLQLTLPGDYKSFLKKDNGAKIEQGKFFVKELKQEILMDTLFGFEAHSKALDIIAVNKEFEDDLPPESLLIGDEPGGGFILLVNDGKNNGVYYYDHAYDFEQSSDDKNTYLIAKSFDEFLKML